MKKTITTLCAILLSSMVMSQGIEFRTASYAEALKMAQKEKKLIFVDVYTSWCGPCKEMSANIFTQAAAGEFFNKNFINLKVDAEKTADGKKIAKDFVVTAYPTLLFVNGKGKLTYKFLGGRTVDGFVQEGEKALNAYKRQPELIKNEKQFNKGERGIEFLNNYYELLLASGLDVSKVLLEYFEQVSNNDLFRGDNTKRIEKVSSYDQSFAERVVNSTLEVSKNKDADPKQLSDISKSVAKYLSAAIRSASSTGTEQDFDQILALKDKLFTIECLKNSVTTATMGGGTIYLPSELIRMDYYKAKSIADKYISIYDEYIIIACNSFAENNKIMNQLAEKSEKERKEAEKNNDKETLKRLKQTSALMSIFFQMDIYYASTALLNGIETYDSFYKGEKDKAYQNKIMGWYETLFESYPSTQSAPMVANKFIDNGMKDKAIFVLNKALEKGRTLMGATPEHAEECEQNLAKLQ